MHKPMNMLRLRRLAPSKPLVPCSKVERTEDGMTDVIFGKKTSDMNLMKLHFAEFLKFALKLFLILL